MNICMTIWLCARVRPCMCVCTLACVHVSACVHAHAELLNVWASAQWRNGREGKVLGWCVYGSRGRGMCGVKSGQHEVQEECGASAPPAPPAGDGAGGAAGRKETGWTSAQGSAPPGRMPGRQSGAPCLPIPPGACQSGLFAFALSRRASLPALSDPALESQVGRVSGTLAFSTPLFSPLRQWRIHFGGASELITCHLSDRAAFAARL